MKLSERDVCTKFITPTLVASGWDVQTQIREEVSFTKGRVIVRGKLHSRSQAKRADYVLYARPNQPVALIEAKDPGHSVGAGMQQALDYAEALDVPFVFSNNGSGFLFHDRSGRFGKTETELGLADFPSPETLWQRYCEWKGLDGAARATVEAPYYNDGSSRTPRYYQANAINRTVEAVARGQRRILLVMATGTGKTYTAFQIIWRLWKSRVKKRILFLADRNILVDQTRTNDFRPFGAAMTKIEKRQANKAFEIYLSLYQAVTGTEDEQNIYRQFSPDFFDLVDRRMPSRQRGRGFGLARHPRPLLVGHVAFDRPALSRRERAEQARKSDVFTRHGEQARAVLDALLDKYADTGIRSIEDIKVLTLDPFNRMGTPGEIIGAFGDKAAYLAAAQTLRQQTGMEIAFACFDRRLNDARRPARSRHPFPESLTPCPSAPPSNPSRTSCARMSASTATPNASASSCGCSFSRSTTTRNPNTNCSTTTTARRSPSACAGATGRPTPKASPATNCSASSTTNSSPRSRTSSPRGADKRGFVIRGVF